MRSILALSSLLSLAIVALPQTAAAGPATQACLGDLDKLLTCPAGAEKVGASCRSREPKRGQGAGEHWSGSKRQGPSVFLQKNGKVSFAASYKDHKKQGRVYRFDKAGVLASWSDISGDEIHGLNVTCLPDGRVSHVASFKNGKVTGVSRSWKTSDGSFSFATDYSSGKPEPVQLPPALQQRPDALCQPARCDLNAAPDLSGVK